MFKLKPKTVEIIKRKHYHAYILFFILGLVSAFTFSWITASKLSEISSYDPIRKTTSNKLIAPLLLIGDSKSSHQNDGYSRATSNYIDEKIKDGTAQNIAYYFKDLTSGEWSGNNENERFAPASLMKVPVMIAVLKQAEIEPKLLEKKLFYDGKKDLNTVEYYKPEKSLEPRKEYSIEELLNYMIVYSDNNATSLLLTVISADNLKEIFDDLGLPIPEGVESGSVDYLSTRLYSRLFRVLYNSTYLNEEYSMKALKILTEIDFPEGIMASVPKNILVANKFGERTVTENDGTTLEHRELHDCGIVYVPNKPYLICIMTKGSDFKKLETIIQTISKMTYDKMTTN